MTNTQPSVPLSALTSSPEHAPTADAARQTNDDATTESTPKLDANKPESSSEYVTGAKLAVVVAAVAFASFLMLLDTMIVSTVGRTSRP
jgi:hypothetical protein